MKKNISNLEIRLPVKLLNRILSMLLFEMKDLSDEDRDLPIRWNIMHMYTSSRIGKIQRLNEG